MPRAFEELGSTNFNLPLIFEVLNKENLKPISPEIGGGKIVCEDIGGNQFLMKNCGHTEKIIFTNVLPAIRQQNLPFRRLQLPELRNIVSKKFQQNNIQKDQDFIFLKYYDETRFNDKWNEISALGYGGRGLDISVAEKIVDLIADFSLIDVPSLSIFNLPTFDYAIWKKQNLPYIANILIGRSIIDQSHIDKALSIFSFPNLFQHSKMILTNGDFYPRNLIELPDGKIAIIDWESRQDYEFEITTNGTVQNLVDQRNVPINYLENHLAFFFIHMWGNYAFQRHLIKSATKKFNLSSEDLQSAILIKSIEQALIWPDDLSRRQAEIFVNALETNFIKDLMR